MIVDRSPAPADGDHRDASSQQQDQQEDQQKHHARICRISASESIITDKTVTASEISDVFETMLLKDSLGDVAAQSDLAKRHGGPTAIEFRKAIAELIDGNIDRAVDRAFGEFLGRSHIDEQLII